MIIYSSESHYCKCKKVEKMEKLWNNTHPKIIVEPPGPVTRRILESAGLPADFGTPITKRSEGIWIEDPDGNIIMDFISGRCTVNVGHSNPRLLRVVHEQVDRVTHGYTEERLLLEKELARITPGSPKKRAVYAHSGSDANDAAIKLARWATKKPYIICFTGAYHGVTYGALSISSYQTQMVKGFGPNLPGIYHMPYPYCYRCPFGHSSESCGLDCLRYIENYAFKSYLPPEEVAAAIVEPVAGDAGWHVPPREWMRGLRELCSKYNILLISEEVQTGFGRMGSWFGIQHFDVVPDAIVLGKAMAGGAAPMSGVVFRSDLGEGNEGKQFYHGHTMGGHPVGVAATLENIKIIEEENLVSESKIRGNYLIENLRKDLMGKCNIVGDIRGVGLLIGVEIIKPDEKDTYGRPSPAPKFADEICRRAMKKGLWTIKMGAYGTAVLRVAPPLIINKSQLDVALGIFESSIIETEKANTS
jgi:4-aminobutyrate aminotransferase